MNGVVLGYAVVAFLVGIGVLSFVVVVLGVVFDRPPKDIGCGCALLLVVSALTTAILLWLLGLFLGITVSI